MLGLSKRKPKTREKSAFGLRELAFRRKLIRHSPQLVCNFREIRPLRRFRRPTSHHQSSPVGIAWFWHWRPQCVANNTTYKVKHKKYVRSRCLGTCNDLRSRSYRLWPHSADLRKVLLQWEVPTLQFQMKTHPPADHHIKEDTNRKIQITK